MFSEATCIEIIYLLCLELEGVSGKARHSVLCLSCCACINLVSGRYFSIGGHSYSRCKECRHNPTTIVVTAPQAVYAPPVTETFVTQVPLFVAFSCCSAHLTVSLSNSPLFVNFY